MISRDPGFNKKPIAIVLFLVTALFISGLVIYNGMLRAEVISSEVALSMDQAILNQAVTSTVPVVEPVEVEPAVEQPAEANDANETMTQPVPALSRSMLQEPPLPFNQLVLAQISTYNKGSYPYLLNTDYSNYNGVTVNLYYQGKLLLKAHPSGNRANHCVGITFEVFYRAMMDWNKQQRQAEDTIKGLSYEQLYDFILKWYAAGPKSEYNLGVALEKYKLGKQLTNFEEARPGDFIDFSRENQTGHTVVLINWVRVSGKIVGMRYWSSQESTNGIDYKTEYFNILRGDGSKYGSIMKETVIIGRVIP